MTGMSEFDVVVAGAGPAGLAGACLLAQSGCETACIAPDISEVSSHDPHAIKRTVALMQPAIRLLESLNLWPGDLIAHCAPLKRLKIVDDTLDTFSAPTVVFTASELGMDEFGWNVPLELLVSTLTQAADKLGVKLIPASVMSYDVKAGLATLTLSNAEHLKAKVVIGADGRQSTLRRDAGIATSEWSYDQVALAMSFTHTSSHHCISSEYHKTSGPFTTVPLPGNASSLVWMVKPHEADEISNLSDDQLASRLQLEMHGDLGLVQTVTRPMTIPMRGLTARKFAANRVLLVGEAAHVVPPIGAQGLNMSLRDGAVAAEMISDAMRLDEDLGSEKLCQQYDAQRRADVLPRQAAVDTMNRSLTSQYFPLHLGRALGMTALQNIPPLRKRAMLQGMNPEGSLPRVMRG